jgi:hypothetical protein
VGKLVECAVCGSEALCELVRFLVLDEIERFLYECDVTLKVLSLKFE